MKKITYKKYSKLRMLQIIKRAPFVFVETSYGNTYIIKKKDLADFIVLETRRTNHKIEMYVFVPGIDNPVLTTYGWFINKSNPLIRDEIIKRLVKLQNFDSKPKNVKIFNNDLFVKFNKKQLGIENNKVKNFDKYYRKYEKSQIKNMEVA